MVVGRSPLADHLLGLSKRTERFAPQAFIAKPAVEALDVAIFPGAAWFDIGSANINASEKLSNAMADEFRPVVTSDEFWNTSDRKYIHQKVDQIITREPARNLQGNAFPGVLIDQRQDLQRTPLVVRSKIKSIDQT